MKKILSKAIPGSEVEVTMDDEAAHFWIRISKGFGLNKDQSQSYIVDIPYGLYEREFVSKQGNLDRGYYEFKKNFRFKPSDVIIRKAKTWGEIPWKSKGYPRTFKGPARK